MEEQCSLKWKALLKVFENIDRNSRGAKEEYEQLKELANLENEMTPRQKSGIVDRCNYRIRLIDNPDEIPFANNEREEKRLQLSKEKSNGKQP